MSVAYRSFLATAGKLREEKRLFETYKQDYTSLSERLSTLADETVHPVMVPLGPLAFMPGRLIHTNEILVLLGDNWFAERSAKQAKEIVARREMFVDSKLQQIQKDLQNMEARVAVTSNLLSEMDEMEAGDLVHIVEEFEDESSSEPSKAYTISNRDIHNLAKGEAQGAKVPAVSGARGEGLEEAGGAVAASLSSPSPSLKSALKSGASSGDRASQSLQEGGSGKARRGGGGDEEEAGGKSVHFHPLVESQEIQVHEEPLLVLPGAGVPRKKPTILEIQQDGKEIVSTPLNDTLEHGGDEAGSGVRFKGTPFLPGALMVGGVMERPSVSGLVGNIVERGGAAGSGAGAKRSEESSPGAEKKVSLFKQRMAQGK